MTEHRLRVYLTDDGDRYVPDVGDIVNPPASRDAMNLAARFAMREYIVEGSDDVQSYDMSEDYFRFLFADGGEPTNNHNEQQIRPSVSNLNLAKVVLS